MSEAAHADCLRVSDLPLPVHCRTCPVAGTGFCAGLAPASTALFRASTRHVCLPADSEFRVDAHGSGAMSVVSSGYLRRVVYTHDGRRRIIGHTFPGEIVEVASDGDDAVEASTDARVCQVDRRVFDRLLDGDPMFRSALRSARGARLRRLHRLNWILAVLSPEERLCSFLTASLRLMPLREGPDGPIVTMELKRKEIADLLDTTVESISRILHRLDGEGLIRIVDPWHLEIRDLERLSERASMDPDQLAVLFPLRPPATAD